MLRDPELRAAALVSIIVFLCAGCGGGQSTIAVPAQQAVLQPAASDWPAGLPIDGVQPWEELDAGGNVIPAQRAASIYDGDSEFCCGAEYVYSSLVGLTDHGDAVLFCSGAALSGEVTWAYWRMLMYGEQPGAISADVNPLPMSDGSQSEYYLGLSDYGAGNWDWYGPFSDNHVRLSTAANVAAGSDYLSPLGNLFICAVACNGATFDVVGVAANACDDADTEPPPAPAGLTATPIMGGLELAWNGVIAGDLAGYRVYWRDDWFFDQQATGVKTVGWLEGNTRHMLPLSTDAPVHLRVAAIDLSGNESGCSELAIATPLTGAAPALQLTASAPSGMLNDTITLTATGADSYDWDLDGDGSYEVTEDTTGTQPADTSATGMIRPAVRGSLGDAGCISCGSVSLLIAGNSRPVATAYANPASGTAPLSVTFTGSGADADGTIEGYAWDFDGDGTYDYNSDTQPNPPVQVYSNAGLYNAKLRVTDDQDAWDVDTVAVNVLPPPDPLNQPPVADLSGSTAGGNPPLQVHYDASASSDSDGTILWYAWDFTGDGIYTGLTDVPTYTYEYNEAGLYICKVRVVDDDGACATDTFEVTVNLVGNELPVAGLTATPLSGDAPLTVSFGEDASDPDGGIVRYDWDFDGDGLYEIYDGDDEPEYTYTQPGIYSAGIRVTDDDGAQDSATLEITVNVPGNTAPTANLTVDVDYGQTPLEVGFDAQASNDPDGTIVRYDWDFDGDGNYELYDGGDSPDWTYSTYGSYTAEVRVTDDDGAQDKATAEVGACSWSAEAIDIQGDVGRSASLARVNSNPAISYYDADNGDLKYIRACDKYGSAWNNPVVVDSAGDVGDHSSLCVVNGHPAISYYDWDDYDLKYVRASDASGSGWNAPVTVVSAGDAGDLGTSLCVVNGNPAISYYDYDNGDLEYVRASNQNGSAWNTPLALDSTGDVGKYSSMRVVNGNPAISYYDHSNYNLKYVRASNASGTSWNTPLTVDSSGVGLIGSCLCVVNGSPAISYYGSSSGHLKYIQASDATGSTWDAPMVVDSSNDVGWYTSMISYGGKAYIGYYAFGADNLKFAAGSFPD